MANKRARRHRMRNHSALTSLASFLIAVAAAALALGPDTWMEWIMWGITVISTQAMKLIFAAVAGGILVWLMWPILNQAATKPR